MQVIMPHGIVGLPVNEHSPKMYIMQCSISFYVIIVSFTRCIPRKRLLTQTFFVYFHIV